MESPGIWLFFYVSFPSMNKIHCLSLDMHIFFNILLPLRLSSFDIDQSKEPKLKRSKKKTRLFATFHKAYFEKYGKKINESFLHWFIGFAEGDGCLIVFSKGKWVSFIITQKEKNILEIIQKELGFGSIKFVNEGHGHYRYLLSDKINN